jgi:17beta-estradiol 17-dehydrogenase / very-long-chain 3-oxoacyl-CoA reductase
MDAVNELLQRVPQAVQLGLIAVGALFLGSKLLSFLRLVLNSFVLSGVNVSLMRHLTV